MLTILRRFVPTLPVYTFRAIARRIGENWRRRPGAARPRQSPSTRR